MKRIREEYETVVIKLSTPPVSFEQYLHGKLMALEKEHEIVKAQLSAAWKIVRPYAYTHVTLSEKVRARIEFAREIEAAIVSIRPIVDECEHTRTSGSREGHEYCDDCDALLPVEPENVAARTYDCRGLYDQYGQLELANPSASTIEEIADALRKSHPSHQFTVVEQLDGVQALKIVANGRKSTLEFLEDDKVCACLMTNYCADGDGTCDHVKTGDFQKCERYKAMNTNSAVTVEDVARVINQPRNPLSVTICKDGGEQEQITFTDLEPNNVTAARINAKLREHGYDASMVAAMTPLSMLESAERRMASAEERCENAQKREQAWVDWFEELRMHWEGVYNNPVDKSLHARTWQVVGEWNPWPSLEDERAEAIQDE